MPNKNGRTTEYEMSLDVLRYFLRNPHGEASQVELREAIPGYVDLTDGDMEDSPSRPGEKRWEQILRNIQSHHVNPRNFIKLGYLEHVSGGGLRLTPKGRKFILELDAS